MIHNSDFGICLSLKTCKGPYARSFVFLLTKSFAYMSEAVIHVYAEC